MLNNINDSVQPNLRRWFRDQFSQIGYNQTEFSQRSGISRTIVNGLLTNETTRAGHETCQKLARYFKVPLQNVLEMAGLIPRISAEKKENAYLIYLYEQLDSRGKKDALTIVEALVDARPSA